MTFLYLCLWKCRMSRRVQNYLDLRNSKFYWIELNSTSGFLSLSQKFAFWDNVNCIICLFVSFVSKIWVKFYYFPFFIFSFQYGICVYLIFYYWHGTLKFRVLRECSMYVEAFTIMLPRPIPLFLLTEDYRSLACLLSFVKLKLMYCGIQG